MNVEERGNELVITVEAPGVNKDDVEVLTGDNSITIRGQKRQETQDQNPNYHRVERSFGSFERTVVLPVEVDADKAEANFKDGILEIKLPKSGKAKESFKKIPVSSVAETRSAKATSAPFMKLSIRNRSSRT